MLGDHDAGRTRDGGVRGQARLVKARRGRISREHAGADDTAPDNHKGADAEPYLALGFHLVPGLRPKRPAPPEAACYI